MKYKYRFLSTLNTSLSKSILTPVLTVALFTMCNAALGQGTQGLFTSHDVVPGPTVLVGDPNNPIPIDLDPNGPPWTKGFFDNSILIAFGGLMDMIETIENVGTESWSDWHEHILGDPFGALPSTWASVVSLEINGSPITFNATGLGTADLWLDTFSQPVLPGDILTIHKQVQVFPNSAGADGVPLMRMQEYPTTTPIPEPGSAVLALLACLTLTKLLRRHT